MKTAAAKTISSTLPALPGNASFPKTTDDDLIKAYQADKELGQIFTIAALRLGLMLWEKKVQILNVSPSSHDGNTGWFEEKRGKKFLEELEKLGIPKTTAYRRMQFAQKVVYAVLGKTEGDFEFQGIIPSVVDYENRVIPLSICVAASSEQLSGQALEFKNKLQNHFADETLAEAARRSASGESTPVGFLRALNGKKHGGKGGQFAASRKDFPMFVGNKLQQICSLLCHFDNFAPEQKLEIKELFRAAVLGLEVSLPRGKRTIPHHFTGESRGFGKGRRVKLPADVCEILRASIRERFTQKRDNGD